MSWICIVYSANKQVYRPTFTEPAAAYEWRVDNRTAGIGYSNSTLAVL